MPRQSDEKLEITVRRAAMNMLARREQSFRELLQKLARKYPDFNHDEIILPALERLRDEKLQSDERFVESYVRYRRNRGFGPVKIEAELFQKGVDSRLVQDALYTDETDWTDFCREAMDKKFAPALQLTLDEQQKRYRFLVQRGFEAEQIRVVLGEM